MAKKRKAKGSLIKVKVCGGMAMLISAEKVTIDNLRQVSSGAIKDGHGNSPVFIRINGKRHNATGLFRLQGEPLELQVDFKEFEI